MCRWDGKKDIYEARDPRFESRPTIFDKNTTKESLRHRFFLPGTDNYGQRSQFRGTGFWTGTLGPLRPVRLFFSSGSIKPYITPSGHALAMRAYCKLNATHPYKNLRNGQIQASQSKDAHAWSITVHQKRWAPIILLQSTNLACPERPVSHAHCKFKYLQIS